MPYQIQPLKEFLVRPALPQNLNRLAEIGYNLSWSWDHNLRSLFRRLDPQIWKECNHNPIELLGRIPQDKLDRAAADPRFILLYKRACERYDAYLHSSIPTDATPRIAYFSMEYGLLDCMQIYSGGLGLLSGDHMKGASDSDFALTGVGLLYQRGYLQQHLNPDGWQQERTPLNDFYTLPVRPALDDHGNEIIVSVNLPTGELFIKVWRIDVGRVKLYVLDTNIPQNRSAEHREITDQLYGGDILKRIRQEIVLGIGGLRALAKLGVKPTVHHMNEGHSAFLAIERIRVLMQENGLSFDQALEATRVSNVFTTHTSVPAGIDIFDSSLLYEHFNDYCNKAGFSFETLLSLGRTNMQDNSQRFSMAVLALKTSAFRNAVSVLHRAVSQEMFQNLWPKLPVQEVPITSVTNGVHQPTWINGDLASLYDQYLQPDWRERLDDIKMWEAVAEIPAQELWEMHRKRKRRMVAYVRERSVNSALQRKASTAEVRRLQEVLDPDVLTIGFARRFATYKRATLLLRDVERLKRILVNSGRPVQILLAGKAHPHDNEGKELIRQIIRFARDPQVRRSVVFLEDYDISVARYLVQGADVWLNTPRRPNEASGTSGMKLLANGGLNLSILDGWWDEAYDREVGWAIGNGEEYSNPEYQDQVESEALYHILENDIVPLYYDRDAAGIPRGWLAKMKASMKRLSPVFSTNRMVAEYAERFYLPAAKRLIRLAGDKARVESLLAWRKRLHAHGSEVKVTHVDVDGGSSEFLVGSKLKVSARVSLGGLSPADVGVEAYYGLVAADGSIGEGAHIDLALSQSSGADHLYAGEVECARSGSCGFAVRVVPFHPDALLPYELPWIHWEE